MKLKLFACLFLVAVLGWYVAVSDHAKANTMLAPTTKAAIVGQITSADGTNYQTLTSLCGRTQSFFFKGYFAFDSGNVGSNVLKTTIDGAADVPCTAGSAKEWNAVSSDTVLVKIAVGDKLNIVGEELAGNLSNGPF